MNMVDTLSPTPTITRSTIIREIRYTFLIQPNLILRDLIKKGLLQPLNKKLNMIVFLWEIMMPIVHMIKEEVILLIL